MKTMVSSIRLPVESWKKLRALLQHYGANNYVKTLWLQRLIDEKYEVMKNKEQK